ncbi:MAG TPA: hypothetical protein VH186_22075 [Chloroflexia bacterium]|nr:hypothetical protein [Chloroflexia bacterium]
MSDQLKNNARKNLEELKKQLKTAQPVLVNDKGQLITPEEEAVRAKVQGSNAVQIKPSRWF